MYNSLDTLANMPREYTTKLNAVPGQHFGRLTVLDASLRIRQSPSRPHGFRAAKCRCDCGTKTVVGLKELLSSGTKTCGNHQNEPRPRRVSSSGYFAIHNFLRRHFPKEGECEECGVQVPTEYALIHGREYSRDRGDYRELCWHCHRMYDGNLGGQSWPGGEQHPYAKLSWPIVADIRRRYPSETIRDLAAEYGVRHGTVWAVVTGKTWRTENVDD